MTLNDVNNAASTKSGSDRTGPDRTGSDWIVHFGLRILLDSAFDFRFLSKIQTGFPNFFRFVFDLSGN